ncbi:MAG TPA: MAPEG family protein, partial [Burkholderiaceae bacterium]|nr:MAPEG family protein [Burkholderiaceae bacterium]
CRPWGRIPMTVQMVLLPVFVQVGLTLALLLAMASARTRALTARETSLKDIALGQPNWPTRVTQFSNCYANQFEIPLLFYILIAIALPLRHADLVIVLLSWVFVVTRFAHAGIFVTSNDVRTRSLAWFAGVLVVFAMWVWFALKILL